MSQVTDRAYRQEARRDRNRKSRTAARRRRACAAVISRCQEVARHIERVSSPYSFSDAELALHAKRLGVNAHQRIGGVSLGSLIMGALPADFHLGAEIERCREAEDRRLEREWRKRP